MMVRILIYCFEKGVSLLFFLSFLGGGGGKGRPRLSRQVFDQSEKDLPR